METRKYDLLQLMEDRKNARSAYHRDLIDKAFNTIMRESGAVRERREKLLMAVRNDDKRAVQRFQQELLYIQANESYGKDY